MGNKLRITAELVNVADGYHLWSERYDREIEDVFAIQDDISQSIVKALRVILSEGEKEADRKSARTNIKAYDYYLRGRQYFHHFRRKVSNTPGRCSTRRSRSILICAARTPESPIRAHCYTRTSTHANQPSSGRQSEQESDGAGARTGRSACIKRASSHR